ncbi:hypothetical protein AB0F72_30210 [Actinoplanes sp. NPDC023936]|uniref:hypothetical protein n=1 Tax=Actinoplanes sp. NPDC023936 TaxID=3154910 RepID=UPI0033D05E61
MSAIHLVTLAVVRGVELKADIGAASGFAGSQMPMSPITRSARCWTARPGQASSAWSSGAA